MARAVGKGKRNRARRRNAGILGGTDEVLSRQFQNEIRNSALWPQMVEQFGEEKAKELLKQCKGHISETFDPDEAGDCPADLRRSL